MTEFERNLLNRLIQDKVITEDIALVAEKMQIEKGGRIDTNLLDIRAVDEDTIIKYLEITSKMKVVPIEKVENISRDIIALLPARLAIRYRLIPFSIDHNTLSLIISDPTDISLLEEISFLLGLDIKPYIAPDLWIEHLLCKHYKIEPNKRYEDLFECIRNKNFEVRSEERIKYEAKTQIPAQSVPKTEVIEVGENQQSPIAQKRQVKEIDINITKPYTYSREEALEDIKTIKDRDAIMFYALKYAYQYFDFCAILIFQKNKIRGFNFLGSDRSIEKDFKALELPISDEMVFKIVRDTGAHFLGTMPLSGNNEVFIKTLKRPFPPNVLVVPISIAGKIIGVFYADNGESLVRGDDVPHILTFFHIVSNQLQELIRFLKFNTPPYEIRFVSKTGEQIIKEQEPVRTEEVISRPSEVTSNTASMAPPETEYPPSPTSRTTEEKISKTEAQSTSTQTVITEEDTLTDEIVNELSQYVEPPQAETLPQPVEEKKLEEKSPVKETEIKKEDISKKEEEYRINLLLDTIEQSPNAINSPAYDEIISIKEKALPYIAKRFPGKLKIDLLMQSSSDISDVEEHSNLIQLIVGIGKEAIPYIAPLTKHSNHTIRFYAVFIFSKLRFQEAIPYLLDAIFDSSPKISLVAIEVLNRYRTFPKFSIVLSRLRSELNSSDVEKVKIAALSLGQFKDIESIPQLIKLLSSKSDVIREAALNALRDICKEDFGYDIKDWQKWWQKHQKIPRVLWMIEGLSHKDENIRYLSIEELKELTGEFFGYFYDAPKKDRERSIERWKEWWKTEGEKRFKETFK